MNPILTTVGAMAAVAKAASTAYYYAEHFGVFNREAKVEAGTRSVEVAENLSADVGFLLSRIPVFDGSGYEIWSSMMKTLFLSQDLWDMVEGGYIEEELTVEVLREVRKKDARALFFIQQAIDKSSAVFSCILGACTSKEAWDVLQKKYQGDAQEPNPVDDSLLSYPADATDAPEVESQGFTDEPKQKKAATDPKEANTKVVEANRIGKEFGDFNSKCDFKEACSANSDSGCGGARDDSHFKMNRSDNSTPAAESAFHSKLKLSEDGIGKESGDIKNNICGSKKGSGGISNRGGRGGKNCGRFNNNQGGHGGTDNGDLNNSRGSRGGQGRGHINNNRGGRGGKGRGHINNKWGGRGGKDHGHFNNNQGDCRGTGSGCFKNQGGCGGLDDGCFNSNKGHNGDIENATESREASDAPQQGHQAKEMIKSTNVYVGNLSESTTEEDLREVFGNFGTIVSIVIVRDGDGKSKCYGFVNFEDADDVAWCIKVMHNGHTFDDKQWCVGLGRTSQKKRVRRAKKKAVDESVPSSTANATESKKAGDTVSEKKFDGKAQKKPVDESVPSSSAKATESKKSGDAVSQKKFNGRAQKKPLDESVPSSSAKATESKKSGDAVSQKKFNRRAKKKSVDESVPSSTDNATESKKAVEAVLKGYRANIRVLYVDNKGVAHFNLKSP